MDEQAFHWLVGILEGEGTFVSASPSGPGLPIVRVSMTDRDVVERVGVLLERAAIPLRARKPHHKRPYATGMKGAPAVELMTAIRPFLGESRRSEIDRAIASWHGRQPRWRRPSAHCSVEGCLRRGAVRGLCRRHYGRWWKAHWKGLVPPISPLGPPPRSFRPQSSACGESCEVAWLAGLLEGEGAFGITGDARLAYPVISVHMCDEDVVARAARMLGATPQLREPENDKWNLGYVAKISGHHAADWMRRLRPYMGSRRTASIDAALAAYHPIRLTMVPSVCVVPGCDRPHRSRGLCNAHYMSWDRDRKKGRLPKVTPLR